ncbi:MAG: Uncharacterized protein XD52_0306 [bacterium 42_11]|nr:MAG: Uncharacterized protein XD52_0306 [bacterium 42_11]
MGILALKAAFVFIAPGADYRKDRTVVKSGDVELHVVGVQSYEEGAKVAEELVRDGISCIELCGGFGNEGVAIVSKAVKGSARVGVVGFDIHPGLEGKSGDDIFL